MIPFDFEYYKPETVAETIDLFNKLIASNKRPVYYGGGTEFISMARKYNVYADAVIDLKGISECITHEFKNNELTIGSCVTLTDIAETNYFPLLSMTVKRIADHTVQGKITLGGNLAGTIIYHEAALPLLVSDSEIVIASNRGTRRAYLKNIFDKQIKLAREEFIVQVIIKDSFLSLPFLHVKRTKNEKIDYPLITIASLKDNGKINIAFSGLCKSPFRSDVIEKVLNDKSVSIDERIDTAINSIPYEVLNDISGSSEYRKFMLGTMLHETLMTFNEVGQCLKS